MCDILILGSMFPSGMEDEIIKKSRASTLQFAANSHLRMIIDGIEENVGAKDTVLNILPIGSYPKRYSDAFIKTFNYSYGLQNNHINVGYCNITLVKQFSKPHRLVRAALRWAKMHENDRFIVLVYTIEPEFLAAAMALKKKYNCHVCQIVTDLPEYTDMDKGGKYIFRLATRYRVKNTFAKIGSADSYVFLTKQMAEHFGVENKPYIVMEGLVPDKNIAENKYISQEIKYIVYTGSLTKKYGVMDLMDAFLKLKNPNYRLVICGSGEAEQDIRNITDKRVIFKGALPHKEAKELQSKATILVNPRGNNEEFTKYSFPSKIMEYMLTGRPVLCFKLDGMPDEYDDYLNYFESTESMAEEIEKYCQMPEEELTKIGKKAQQYVLENKNVHIQTKRMLEMIDNCMNS